MIFLCVLGVLCGSQSDPSQCNPDSDLRGPLSPRRNSSPNALDTYRASGPGGQKRNKTSSAVRLRHIPSGLIVIAEESRSQHENKARALRRLHRALWLELREPIEIEQIAQHPAIVAVMNAEQRLVARPRSADYWPAVAVILDLLDANGAAMRDAATALGTTTANLIDFLSADDQAWKSVNVLRSRHGQSPLRA